MLNFKLSVIILTGVLGLATAGLLVNNNHFGDLVHADMEHDLVVAREVVLRSKALDVHGQLGAAKRIAAWPNFSEKLLRPYAAGIEGLDERHQLVWEELSVWVEKLRAERAGAETGALTPLEDTGVRVPDEMLVVDAGGSVVARFTDYAWWGNQISKDLPVVLEVAKRRDPVRDLWNAPGVGMLEVTVAPIHAAVAVGEPPVRQEKFLGSLVLGFKMSDTEAERLKKLTGVDVVFFYGSQMNAGTVGVDLLRALNAYVTAETDLAVTGRLSPDAPRDLLGRGYRMAAGLFTGYDSQAKVGFLVLLDTPQRLQPVSQLNTYLPLAAAVAVFFMIGLALWAVRSFTRPFEELDQGVHEFINGNTEYTFPTTARGESLAGNMAHSLNLMVCILQGRPVPDDEDLPSESRGAGGWRDPLFIDDVSGVRKRPALVGLPGTPKATSKKKAKPATEPPTSDGDGDSVDGQVRTDPKPATVSPGPETRQLVLEPEDIYLKRLFDEYLTSREANGEPTQGITFDKFRAKVGQSEASIREKLSCRMVRFRVQTKDGRTTLKPVPLD